MSQFAVYCEQHGGVVRIVAHQCGWLGCRVGEASNPGPGRLTRPMEGRDVRPRRSRRVQDDEEFRFDASMSLREPDPVPIRPPRRVAFVPHCPGDTPQGPSGSVPRDFTKRRLIRRGWSSQVPFQRTLSTRQWQILVPTAKSTITSRIQQPGRRRTTRRFHDVVPPSLLDDLEHDLRPTPADDDSFNPTLGNVTMIDTASDASGAARQVSARRGKRLRILGTQPTVEDLPSTTDSVLWKRQRFGHRLRIVGRHFFGI